MAVYRYSSSSIDEWREERRGELVAEIAEALLLEGKILI